MRNELHAERLKAFISRGTAVEQWTEETKEEAVAAPGAPITKLTLAERLRAFKSRGTAVDQWTEETEELEDDWWDDDGVGSLDGSFDGEEFALENESDSDDGHEDCSCDPGDSGSHEWTCNHSGRRVPPSKARKGSMQPGRTDSKSALRSLSNADWEITPSGVLPGYCTLSSSSTGYTYDLPNSRTRKAQLLLDYSSMLECMDPTLSTCNCKRKCWDKFDRKAVVIARSTIAGLINESAVGMYLLRNIQRDDGFVFQNKEVCRSFYAKVHGVSVYMCKKARMMSKHGAGAVWAKSTTKLTSTPAQPGKGDFAYAFWDLWFGRLCQKPNDEVRLFPADKSYSEIWKDCFLPWWKQQGQDDSKRPTEKYWQQVRKHKDFKDVKRRAKHFHCRCTVCATLKHLHLVAFTSATCMAYYQAERRRHEEAVRAWRLLETRLDAEARQCPSEVVYLSFDATNEIVVPHLSNRPLKGFTAGGAGFTPWLITNHGTRQREYIYVPKGKWAKGANYVLTQVMAMLRRIKSDASNPQHMARRLVLVADNASENKNATLLAWACDIVSQKWFNSVEFLFGEVGHTHNGNDATHKVHNCDLGRRDAGDLGELIWNYRFPWANESLRPRASVLDVFYDWDTFYEGHVTPLSGVTKTTHDTYIVRGFLASRGRNNLVDIKWKADPATDQYWRGHDGLEKSEGFYVLRNSPSGVPATIEGETQLQLPKYSNKLVSKKARLDKVLAPWDLAAALKANHQQIVTGVVPAVVLEDITPIGEWGPLCTIGIHPERKGHVRFIKTVLFLKPGLPEEFELWGLPAGAFLAMSLQHHPSQDDSALINRPLPNIRYMYKENGRTPANPKQSAMWNHANNVAHRAALELHQSGGVINAEQAADEAPDEDGEWQDQDDSESSAGDNSDSDDAPLVRKKKQKTARTFVVSMDHKYCDIGSFVVSLSQTTAVPPTQFIDVGKIVNVDKQGGKIEAIFTACTKHQAGKACLVAPWNPKALRAVETIAASNVICYFKALTSHKKLPRCAVSAIEARKFTWME